MSANPYLAGNFAPVTQETTAKELRVTGRIPTGLNGRYLRNGPNPRGAIDPNTHHWFTGHGMVHGVRLENGRAAWYRNRWVRTEELVRDLGEDLAGRRLGGPNNTHVIGHAGRIWALVEAGGCPVELTDNLETVGANDFFGTLENKGFTAHPKVDPDTGDLHAMCYSWPAWQDHIQYVHVGRDGRVKRTVNVPVPGMVMIHDMSLTANYAVIYDLPVTIDFNLAAQGVRFPFAWNPSYAPRVGLLPRRGDATDVIWCEVSACAVFHPMNAYEDANGRVVIDLCRYERMFLRDHQGPLGDNLATLDRWTIDPKTRRVNEERIDARGQEFPRCHASLSTKPYRFGYTVAAAPGAFPAIYKHDLAAGTSATLELPRGWHAAEPYFVPRQDAESEDDGHLLTYVFDASTQTSELAIFDARTMSPTPVASVHLPVRVPYGFHGSWIADGADGPSV